MKYFLPPRCLVMCCNWGMYPIFHLARWEFLCSFCLSFWRYLFAAFQVWKATLWWNQQRAGVCYANIVPSLLVWTEAKRGRVMRGGGMKRMEAGAISSDDIKVIWRSNYFPHHSLTGATRCSEPSIFVCLSLFGERHLFFWQRRHP